MVTKKDKKDKSLLVRMSEREWLALKLYAEMEDCDWGSSRKEATQVNASKIA